MQNNGDNDINRYCSDVIKDADEFVVYVFDHEDATDYTRMVFDDPEIAGRFKQGANMLTTMQRDIVEDLTKPSSFLDRMVEAEQSDKSKPIKTKDQQTAELVQSQVVPDLVFGMSPEEFEEKFKKLKKKFKKKRAEFETKAKDALMEAAKIYLGEKHTAAYEKYKLELNKSGLSTIMYQVHTMHKAADALIARIQASGSMMSTKDIEAFTGLQRIMLDVQKFQFEYMQSIESSMKDLKADLEVAEHGTTSGPQDSEGGIIFFKGGKDFLKQLASMKNSMNDFVPTASKNKILNPSADVVDITHEESPSGDQTAEKQLKNPFSGYEGAPKKQKHRRGEFEGEEGDDDDIDI